MPTTEALLAQFAYEVMACLPQDDEIENRDRSKLTTKASADIEDIVRVPRVRVCHLHTIHGYTIGITPQISVMHFLTVACSGISVSPMSILSMDMAGAVKAAL